MKSFIDLKYRRNSKNEIIFENLDEIKYGSNVVLRLQDGDIRPIALIDKYSRDNEFKFTVYVPYLSKQGYECLEVSSCCYAFGEMFGKIKYCYFDSDVYTDCSQKYSINLMPKWDIPKDNAVLFLNANDCRKYYDLYKSIKEDIELHKKITIIAPEIHAEPTRKECQYHIENYKNIAKESKEKYDVKEVNICASHCHGYIDLLDWENCEGNMLTTLYFQTTQDDDYDAVNNAIKLNINKITTTNSTGILEVQKSDRLEVVNVKEFFFKSLES